MSSQNIYVTDYGTLPLTQQEVRWIEEAAMSAQNTLWERFGDELIGVPEVEPFNNRVVRHLERRARG